MKRPRKLPSLNSFSALPTQRHPFTPSSPLHAQALPGKGGVYEVECHLTHLRATTPLSERHHIFLEQCRMWHPDKNVGDEQRATRAFQRLQALRPWFLSDAEVDLV
jgi:hypothetical protein